MDCLGHLLVLARPAAAGLDPIPPVKVSSECFFGSDELFSDLLCTYCARDLVPNLDAVLTFTL